MSRFAETKARFAIGELLHSLWALKVWWLLPLVVVLLLFGAVLVFSRSGPLAPFLYTLF